MKVRRIRIVDIVWTYGAKPSPHTRSLPRIFIAHGIPGGDEKGSLGGGRKEIRWEREEAEEGGKGKSLEDMK